MILIVNRFANDAVVSRHASQETADKAMERLVRRFRKTHSKKASHFEKPIFPYNFKEV